MKRQRQVGKWCISFCWWHLQTCVFVFCARVVVGRNAMQKEWQVLQALIFPRKSEMHWLLHSMRSVRVIAGKKDQGKVPYTQRNFFHSLCNFPKEVFGWFTEAMGLFQWMGFFNVYMAMFEFVWSIVLPKMENCNGAKLQLRPLGLSRSLYAPAKSGKISSELSS